MNRSNLLRHTMLSGFGALVAVSTASGQSAEMSLAPRMPCAGAQVAVQSASVENWTTQYVDATEGIYAIKAVDENTVWAGGSGGVYFKTTDGGTNWERGTVPGAPTLSFYSLAPFDQNTAYLLGEDPAGGDGRIYKTTDGGDTWTMQYQYNPPPPYYLTGLAFWDKDNGFAYGDPIGGNILIVTTNNGGETWERVPTANVPRARSNEATGWGGVVEGTSNAWFGTILSNPVRIYRSTDKGRTWTVANTPLYTEDYPSGSFFTSLTFIDSLNGYATGGPNEAMSNNIARTTDGGKTWSLVTSYQYLTPSALTFVPGTGNLGLVAATPSGSFYSQDGAATWNSITSDGFFEGLSFADPSAGWSTGCAVTRSIMKFNGNVVTAVKEDQSDAPLSFELAQNYPNPFNPGTRIKFQLPAASAVHLEVMSLMGQHVATLIEGSRTAGEHELTWDGKNDFGQPVASGVYLSVIRAGEFTQTKKMVLTR